jgi:hypothetical protein
MLLLGPANGTDPPVLSCPPNFHHTLGGSSYQFRLSALSACMRCCAAELTVSGPNGAAGQRRGVYLREPHTSARVSSHTVTITPTLHEVTFPFARLGEPGSV